MKCEPIAMLYVTQSEKGNRTISRHILYQVGNPFPMVKNKRRVDNEGKTKNQNLVPVGELVINGFTFYYHTDIP